MTKQGTSGMGPLAQHHDQYSLDGLFLRYARGQIRIFWTRLVFFSLIGLILSFVFSPWVGGIAYVIAVSADALDNLSLRYVCKTRPSGAAALRLKRINTLTALLQGIAMAFGASAPFWAGALTGARSLDHVDPLFTVGLLTGAAINAGFLLPYHRPATFVRLTVFALTPLILLMSGAVSVHHMEFQLQLAGMVILFGAMAWYLYFISRNFSRTRSILLTQALQQQELEGAYQRLLDQQAEAKKLALVARHANDSILIFDKNAKVQWVNEAFTKMTGYRLDEIQGRSPGDLLNHSETDPNAIREIEGQRKKLLPFRVEILNRHKDGQKIWIETNQVPIRDHGDGTMAYIAVERDITAAKQNAQQLEEARRAAEASGRAKSDFLATMSHEIRTPMNGVIGMAQLLEETALDKEQKLYTDTILSSARTLLALINDILDLSKLDAEQITLNPSDFDLHLCFDETIRLLRTQAEVKGLQLIYERDAALPRYLHGDDHRLRQILINLVGNAIKFTEKGRVKVSVEAEPDAQGGVRLRCAIADTGIGIPKEMLTGIFERFSQAEAATSRRFGGTGLGLAISRRLAETMGGRITVSSEVDTGSCFTVCLPFGTASSAKAPELSNAVETRQQGEALAGLRLLVAEDNRVNRLLLQKFLKQTDLELSFAHDGGEAVDMARRLRPDIILMDVSMPVMDGLEATQTIRSWGQPQPVIIALTANAFDTDREACLSAGMDEFLTKPINRNQLLEVLARYRGRIGDRARAE